MNRPVLTIIAGSNGCGKSTLTSSASDKFQQTPILDPDAMAKSLQSTLGPQLSNIEAGKQILLTAENLIESGQSFVVETSLSGSTYLRMAARAKEVGFEIAVVFVGTDSVEINLERVKARVEKGRHDVPEEDQRRCYPRTLANIKKLLPLANSAIILDNSTVKGHTMVAFLLWGEIFFVEPLPGWTASLFG